MHVFFSGIGGSGIGPMALIAKQAGYQVSGSDTSDSSYIEALRQKGIDNISIGQTTEQIAKINQKTPIDWFVYSSALPLTNPNHPELVYCEQNHIKTSKRDEFLSQILKDKNLKLIAVAGTHGKTTTTAMVVWLFTQLNIPVSYSLGAKTSFADMGRYDPTSAWFVYEADEFDRNFLSFYPDISIITGIDWDHPDIYPTRESYYAAFSEFIEQSTQAALWHEDAERLLLQSNENLKIIDDKDPAIDRQVRLAGRVNRLDAWLVAQSLSGLFDKSTEQLVEVLNQFPGVSRRFEQIAPNLYSDYAHTPPKIRGALQLAHEAAGDNVVVIYEGLHNLRQHFIKDELAGLFDGVKKAYVVPTYLAREDPDLELLTPEKIVNLLVPHQNLSGTASNQVAEHQVFGAGLSKWAQAAKLDDELKENIEKHLSAGDLVLCLSAGGTGSLDEWLRAEFIP